MEQFSGRVDLRAPIAPVEKGVQDLVRGREANLFRGQNG
jgi:hypothetical protein